MEREESAPTCDEIKARVIASQAFDVIETMLPDDTNAKRQVVRAGFEHSYKLRCGFVFSVVLRRIFKRDGKSSRRAQSVPKMHRLC